MNAIRLFVVLIMPCLLQAELTLEQKLSDFQYVASVYAKNYGPYEWKVVTQKFDMLNIGPWLARVSATKTDLEFYDLLSEYVASLNDAHDSYFLPTSYVARLNFTVDIYDDKLIVDSINRTRLPALEFGASIGYELVSIDGVDARRILERLLRYGIAANERSTRRLAAQLITSRSQSAIPDAANVPEISTVVFRRTDGKLETYRIPWTKSGLPLVSVGKLPSPVSPRDAAAAMDPETVLGQLQNCLLPDKAVNNYGSVAPVFSTAISVGYTPRMGLSAQDFFYSGVFNLGIYNVGYIRIPNFSGPTAAIAAFQREIAYFQANTDGLIVDVMRNPGGNAGYANRLLSFLMPTNWTAVGFEVRATSFWVVAISSALEQLKAGNAPASLIAQFQALMDEIVSANEQMRGTTRPIALDTATLDREPAKDNSGSVLAYTKPILVLIDETSASAADMFAATIQDNQRGPLFGMRTMGAGGNVISWAGGSYSQGSMTVTQSLMVRSTDVVTPDFAVTRYVENVGVRPDIEYDYMTIENLRRQGGAFVDAMLLAIYQHISASRQ
ncbi:MAG: hypothetical protein HY820_12775 [Acidobacteria bacterium]|nr:hypothetical protein [Acidobacteriota bacterium]